MGQKVIPTAPASVSSLIGAPNGTLAKGFSNYLYEDYSLRKMLRRNWAWPDLPRRHRTHGRPAGRQRAYRQARHRDRQGGAA